MNSNLNFNISNANIKRLLFLGSGSGKSTSFKQLRTIHGQVFLDKDHIHSQVIEQPKNIIELYDELKEDFPTEFGHLKLSSNGEKPAVARYFDYIRNDMDVDESVAQNIEILWKESAIKGIFDNRANFNIDYSSSYFSDEVRCIATHSYVLTDKVYTLSYSMHIHT